MTTKEQWLALHGVCLDAIRSAMEGISDEALAATVQPGDRSVGAEVNHVIQAEQYWLREVGIEPAFGTVPDGERSEARFRDALAGIEAQYATILDEKGLDRDILFGLGRVCQHALYHYVRAIRLRKTVEPAWSPPGRLWERSVDFISDLLILGDEANLNTA